VREAQLAPLWQLVRDRGSMVSRGNKANLSAAPADSRGCSMRAGFHWDPEVPEHRVSLESNERNFLSLSGVTWDGPVQGSPQDNTGRRHELG